MKEYLSLMNVFFLMDAPTVIKHEVTIWRIILISIDGVARSKVLLFVSHFFNVILIQSVVALNAFV